MDHRVALVFLLFGCTSHAVAGGSGGAVAEGGVAQGSAGGGSAALPVGEGGSTSGGTGTGSSGDAAAESGGAGMPTTVSDELPPFAPALGKTSLLIGQSGRRAHVDYVLGTSSVPAGGSVYAELYSGRLLSFEQRAFVDYLAREQPGALVEVGLSWKDNRVNAGYCDMADAACVARDGAVQPELDIAAGKYDAALSTFAELMKGYAGLKFLVRVDYEVSPNLHCRPSEHDECPAYREAFIHIERTLRGAEVRNAAFVYHPTRGWAKQLYPGAEATDWIAFSVFNHDLCLPTPEGNNGGCAAGAHLDQNLAADLAWAARQGKPILIAEATVQKPSDASAAGFNDYLSRLFEIVEQYPQVRGLTYINMKWAGGWVYGEDWTQGAFGDVDARLARLPATREFFCERLKAGRFVGLTQRPLRCDGAPLAFKRALPAELDAKVYDRMVALGTNRCLRMPSGLDSEGRAVAQADCAALSDTGEARVRVVETAGRARLFGDASWLCWSAEGAQLLQRACGDVPPQSFVLEELGSSAPTREVRVHSHDGRCLAATKGATAVGLAACSETAEQTFRL